MKILRTACALILAIHGSLQPALPLESAIETLNNLMPAIVSIKAEGAGMFRSPGGQAVRDPRTGRIVVARTVRTAKFSRDGAGVIIDPAGIIVTNAHIVEHATRITVTLSVNQTLDGTLVHMVPEEDLAFISITPPFPLTALSFADSNAIKLRDRVFTVGSSEVLRNTFSEGIVSGIGKSGKAYGQDDLVDLIQTSFTVYKGDSGGPLIDVSGKLLGLIVANKPRVGHVSYAIAAGKIRFYYQEYATKKQ